MRIVFTGASSFTGFWFIKALVAAGHEVVAPLSGTLARYNGVRKTRVTELLKLCHLVPDSPFGSEAFLQVATSGGPWDLLCHHAADVTNYKSPEFDVVRALQSNTRNLPGVLAALKGARGVLLTGSVFENDEGRGEEPLRAFSPYGLSKGLTWQVFRYYCLRAHLPLSKFVIANPFGPLEEERFTAFLARTWSAGKPAVVKTPSYVRDNIPVDLLAATYVHLAEKAAGGERLNPSGYVESQGAFANRVAREFRARLGWACELELGIQSDFSEPLTRVNYQEATGLVQGWNERRFWDTFADYYSSACRS